MAYLPAPSAAPAELPDWPVAAAAGEMHASESALSELNTSHV